MRGELVKFLLPLLVYERLSMIEGFRIRNTRGKKILNFISKKNQIFIYDFSGNKVIVDNNDKLLELKKISRYAVIKKDEFGTILGLLFVIKKVIDGRVFNYLTYTYDRLCDLDGMLKVFNLDYNPSVYVEIKENNIIDIDCFRKNGFNYCNFNKEVLYSYKLD